MARITKGDVKCSNVGNTDLELVLQDPVHCPLGRDVLIAVNLLEELPMGLRAGSRLDREPAGRSLGSAPSVGVPG